MDRLTQVLIILAMVWIGFAVAVAVAARHRQRSAVLYFLCSALMSPILAIILLGISGGVRRPALTEEGDD
jgi:hypothetical protein